MEEVKSKQPKQLRGFSELALLMLLVMQASQSVNGKLTDSKQHSLTSSSIFHNLILLSLTFVNKDNGRILESLKELFEYSSPIYSNT